MHDPINPTSSSCRGCAPATEAGATFCPLCGTSLNVASDPPASDPTAYRKNSADQGQNVESQGQARERPDPGDAHQEPPAGLSEEEPRGPRIGQTMCTCGSYPRADSLYCHRCGKTMDTTGMPRLRITRTEPDGRQTSFVFAQDEVMIGKASGCELILDDRYTSQQHARLIQYGQCLILEDLGSANGIYVKLQHSIILRAGDQFVVGRSTLRVDELGEPS